MIEKNPTDVEAAFETLLEEIEVEINFLANGEGKGFKKINPKRAKNALEYEGNLTEFRNKTALLRKKVVTDEQSQG